MFLQSADLGKTHLYLAAATAIIFIVATIVTVVKILRWQKNKALDVLLTAVEELTKHDGL